MNGLSCYVCAKVTPKTSPVGTLKGIYQAVARCPHLKIEPTPIVAVVVRSVGRRTDAFAFSWKNCEWLLHPPKSVMCSDMTEAC
jgi:hypothetical protein